MGEKNEHMLTTRRSNRYIQFDAFLDEVKAMGAEWMATGHSASLERKGDRVSLLRAFNPNRDHSYFLCTVPEKGLRSAVFPLGSFNKDQTLELKITSGLEHISKPDDKRLFCAEKTRTGFGEFLHRWVPDQDGFYVDQLGQIIAPCSSITWLTYGQRARLQAGSHSLFVARKDLAFREVIIVPAGEAELYGQGLVLHDVEWRGETLPPLIRAGEEPMEVDCQVRYRDDQVGAQVYRHTSEAETDDTSLTLVLRLEAQVYAPCPGQFTALYHGDVCLGGGVIHEKRS